MIESEKVEESRVRVALKYLQNLGRDRRNILKQINDKENGCLDS